MDNFLRFNHSTQNPQYVLRVLCTLFKRKRFFSHKNPFHILICRLRPRQPKLRLNSLKKVGKERIVFLDFFRNENGKAVRQDFQINREGRPLFTVYICYEFFFIADGNMGFFTPTTVNISGPSWRPVRSFGASRMVRSHWKLWKRASLMTPLFLSSGGTRLRKLPAESVSMAATKGEEIWISVPFSSLMWKW